MRAVVFVEEEVVDNNAMASLMFEQHICDGFSILFCCMVHRYTKDIRATVSAGQLETDHRVALTGAGGLVDIILEQSLGFLRVILK